jgi:Holliday junction resolvase RusA-like endonuclease
MAGVRWSEEQLQSWHSGRARVDSAPAREATHKTATYQITPLGKPRMTQRDRWKQRPAVLRYRAFCDAVRASGVELPEAGAHVTFVLPMPRSWSKRKRAEMDGQPHRQKPDVDNLTKALLDAVLKDDAAVWDIRASKRWGQVGQIIVETVQQRSAA